MTVAHADQINSATPAMPTASDAQKDLTTSQENKQVVTLSSTDDAVNSTSATQTSQEAANSQPVLNDNQPVSNNQAVPDKEYNQWASFTAPTYAGYKPSQAVVDTPNSLDTVVNIGYSQIDVPVAVPDKPVLNIIRYVDQEGNVVKTGHQEGKENDPIKLSLPDGYHYVGSQPVLTISADHSLQIVHVAKDTVPNPQTPDQPTNPAHQSESTDEQTGSTSAKPVVQHQAFTKDVAALANEHATQLPQTGNQNSVLALLGLVSASLAICLG